MNGFANEMRKVIAQWKQITIMKATDCDCISFAVKSSESRYHHRLLLSLFLSADADENILT